MKRALTCLLLSAGLTIACVAWLANTASPTLEIRDQPWLMPTGKIFRGHSPGQVFECTDETLTAIDVVLVQQGDGPIEAVRGRLRARGPEGEILREVVRTPETRGPAWVRFDFDDLPDAAGRRLCFELSPAGDAALSNVSAWISWRGKLGQSRDWGDRILGPELAPFEVTFRSYHEDLSAIAVAFDGLNVPAGECRLDLFREDTGELVRTGRLGASSPIAGGYALFTFEPIEESRWRSYTFRLTLPADARPVGTEEGVSCMNFHGTGEVAAELVGMTHGGALLHDRDLVLRTFGERSASSRLALLVERMGRARLLLVGALATLANTVLLTLLSGRPKR